MSLVRPGRRLRRLLVTAATVTATVAVGAPPAQARTDQPARVWTFADDLTVAPAGAPAKDLHVEVITSGAVNPRVVFDVAELSGSVTFAWPAGCTTWS